MEISRRTTAVAAFALVATLSACATADRRQEAVQGVEHSVQTASALDGKPLNLYVWEKRPEKFDAKRLTDSGRIAVLAHGATTPGRVGFDLQVEGVAGPTHSLMDHLASHGFDVFALDYQGYGRSQSPTCGRCVTTEVAANDINAVVDYVRSLRGVKQVYLLGWSWGTVTASLYTMNHPDRVRRLVLYAPPVWRGPLPMGVPAGEFRPVTEKAARDLFTPGAADTAAIEAFVAQRMPFNRAPNGVLVDLFTRMPLTDPKKISVPTLVILGEKDRLTPVSQTDLPAFFADLANGDKQLSIIPGGGHALMLEAPRARLQFEVLKWFSVDQNGHTLDVAAPNR
jgi:pimeloyl-ACP methyl ester carboxylesterase